MQAPAEEVTANVSLAKKATFTHEYRGILADRARGQEVRVPLKDKPV